MGLGILWAYCGSMQDGYIVSNDSKLYFIHKLPSNRWVVTNGRMMSPEMETMMDTLVLTFGIENQLSQFYLVAEQQTIKPNEYTGVTYSDIPVLKDFNLKQNRYYWGRVPGKDLHCVLLANSLEGNVVAEYWDTTDILEMCKNNEFVNITCVNNKIVTKSTSLRKMYPQDVGVCGNRVFLDGTIVVGRIPIQKLN